MLFYADMGRRAGVSPEQTRSDVLTAAAKVFARAGYDRATVAEIASESGLSTGAIYAHYDGKADLFLAVLRAHMHRELERRVPDDEALDIGSLLAGLGADLDRRPAAERRLLIEAVMAAKHDAKTRQVLSSWFNERHDLTAAAIAAAQRDGALRRDFSPDAAARLATTVLLGSWLLDVLDVSAVAHDDWADLIATVVGGFRA